MTQFSDLLNGYHRFRTADWHRQRDRWTALKDGQEPKVMIIACSDSRVDPAQIFDTLPGEIFVVRNVAALVPPFETTAGYHGVSAALEFAVTQLKVAEVVVMGHEKCGGAKAALTRAYAHAAPGEGGFIANWVHMLDDARDRIDAGGQTGKAAERAMEHEAVRTSLKNLRTFPFVQKALDDRALTIHGAYFSIADGVLHVLGDNDAFSPVQVMVAPLLNDY
ncbi:carbonic anhydrase [Sphingomonas sp. SUN019]|uniref:carbonic anhydrase n=1 Tax=Sphingomonas sp. SUN019 TaxID=2937788 RepID=UPI0021642154|nr:carbonic anhydrase [Sphingomonas sp. SUN019]UVO49223.1 carbonic anhydrase [Sphingomonas sp. SUN019]